ncbi:hypothetical protein LA303_00330 [Candidatus Sulfidibacterium hydrothermale]|uniref:hypothetical protein n=1 Tax=Candidatus Sulfidibacterium hydrothermale TaxID=2875962 RepID=UPI001F0B4661|nr:hypothetical protein [Candidatus Sulfidibacterium hydrothermale]UBM62443.1 hypothetical protein LA303_00330 [Candidatus Sulfidibacterium hydrothermale]
MPLNQEFNQNLQKALYSNTLRFHTSIRPYYFPEVQRAVRYDSIRKELWLHKKKTPDKKWKQKAWDKLFNDDVVIFRTEHLDLLVNPLMNFSFGHDFADDKNTWVNTRGIEAFGRIGNNVTFYTSFYENQAVFPTYVDSWIRKNHVVPGQGIPRSYGDGGFDYSNVTGYINVQAGKHFTFQLGHGRNFLGDGYRSLLLSDVSFPNAFFKLMVNVWHIKYMVLYNQYIDIRSNIPEIGYPRKYSTVHYLSWSVSKRVNLSFFDAVIWQATDTLGNYRGFDLQYLNPVIFLRPVEFSIGSPDNALLGLNLSVIVGKHNVFYGQLAIDEFTLHEVFAGNGYWANKQAFQLGFKSYDSFKIKNLYFQTEFNYVPPYTYSERIERINYGNYNQPIAHPFGANFWESVNFIRYNFKRFFFNYEFLYSIKGQDPPGMNYGGDIYKSYNTRVSDYGNYVGQGIRTRLWYQNFSTSFLINPAYNLNFTIGIVWRNLHSDVTDENTHYFYIGLRTSLRNLYYDF